MTRRAMLARLAAALLILAEGAPWAVAAGKGRGVKKQPPAKPLDLNTATAEELEAVQGIGPATARAIVDYRQKNGPFRRLEELMILRGISEEKLEKLRPWLKVEK